MLVGNKIEHDVFHLFFIHLTMGDRNPRLGHQTLYQSGNRFDRFDPVMNEET